MKTSEEIAVQLSYKIVEYCEHTLSRNQRENQIADLIQEQMESFAKERVIDFHSKSNGQPEILKDIDVNAFYSRLYDDIYK